MPGIDHHQMLTRAAIGRLPARDAAAFGDSVDKLIEEYCLYPDDYYTDPDRTSPYLAFIDGAPFHYLPVEALHYSCEDILECKQYDNPFHRLCTEGFRFYISNMTDALADRDHERFSKLAGSLCHVLEDNLAPPHGLEGALGANMFILDRLIQPPRDNPHFTPTFALTSIKPMDCADHCLPSKLLGTCVEEAVFHLYSRFCQTTLENRLKFVPMVHAVYEGKADEVDKLMSEVLTNAVDVIADALFTAAELGLGVAEDVQTSHLDHTSLTDIYPVCQPSIASSPYRFTPFIKGSSLDAERNAVPMALMMGDGSVREFAVGWGMGAHTEVRMGFSLPGGVYDELTVWGGLHAELGRNGHVEIEWQIDGKSVWHNIFKGGDPGLDFTIDVSGGGTLDLCIRALTADTQADENNCVVAEPTLHRRKD